MNRNGAIKLTRSEFLAKYGDVEVTFENYYQFTFKHCARMTERRWLTVYTGGSADRIYRHNVTADYSWTVRDLMPWFWFAYVTEGAMVIEEYRLSRRTERRLIARQEGK